MDLLCIDDTYPDEYLTWAFKNGVKHPIKDKMYSLRGWKKHATGETGLYLNEINNPKVSDPLLGEYLMEPSFHQRRFVTLDMKPFVADEIIKITEDVR